MASMNDIKSIALRPLSCDCFKKATGEERK